MRIVLLFITTIFAANLSAQQIVTNHDNFNDNQLVFSPEFIKTYHIKSITATNSVKNDGKPIKSGDEYYYWVFDMSGNTTGYGVLEDFPGIEVQDTTEYVMKYNRKDQLTHKSERQGGQFNASTFTYNENGDLLTASNRRLVAKGVSSHFDLTTDSLAYHVINDSITLHKIHNENGAVFKEHEMKYDDQKRLISKKTRLVKGAFRSEERYEYDESGFLKNKTLFPDGNSENSISYDYRYDQLGNVNRIIAYRNGVEKKRIEIVYHDDSIQLKAIIEKDVETNELNIIRYEYEYFSNSGS